MDYDSKDPTIILFFLNEETLLKIVSLSTIHEVPLSLLLVQLF